MYDLGLNSVVFAMAQSSSTGEDDGSGAPILIFFFIVWIGFLVYFIRQRKDFDLTTQTAASPDDVIAQAIRNYSTKGFSVTSNTGTTATFYKNLKPGCLLAILLFCLGIVPGIIYLVIGGRDLTSTISVKSISGGTTSVHVSGNARGFGGIVPAEKLMKSLPPAGGGHF